MTKVKAKKEEAAVRRSLQLKNMKAERADKNGRNGSSSTDDSSGSSDGGGGGGGGSDRWVSDCRGF